jgi:chemotaxis protein methyltransferase CheR
LRDTMTSADLRDIDYEKISRLVYEQCGINLHEGKKELVKARLGKRLREGNFKSFGEYYRHVLTDEGTAELISMIDSLSTNLTYFFREESHFQTLRNILKLQVNPAKQDGLSEKMRIWSAGCSTGEEPYSLAMTIHESLNGCQGDVKIMATDISTRVLHTADKGIFGKERLNNVPPAILKKYFQMGFGACEGQFLIKKSIRDMVQFSRFNLMDTPPSNYRFDIIFCRNVMIYFDKPTQEGLVNRFYRCLNRGGYLFVGHSESLTGLSHQLKYIEPSVYRKQA